MHRFTHRLPALGAAVLVGAGLCTLASVACGPAPSFEGSFYRPGGDDADDEPGATPGSGSRDTRESGGYDPGAPINTGTPVNTAGFTAVLPVLQKHCGECHHAGTWLALETGADAKTISEVVRVVEAGTMPPSPRARLGAAEVDALKAWRDGRVATITVAADDPPTAAVTPILAASTLASYKAALPKVGWSRLAKVLASPSTLFFDKAVMPPAYQDTVGDGSSLPFGARRNDGGRSLIVPEGKKLFADDGSTWAFPFGHTAGTDASTNTFVVNFLSLPADGSSFSPVVYRVETGTAQGFPTTRWNWSFPVGAMMGEVIMVRDGTTLLTTEIRTRVRYESGWATNVFRPFPTAKLLATAVKEHRSAWQAAPNLAALVGALENTTTLTAKTEGSPDFANLVTLTGVTDAPLPNVGDDALVRELLTQTTFVGAYGTTWKGNGTQKAFGPTGPATGLSVVPNGFDTGLLEVRETTCTKCHDHGGYFIGDLVDQAVLYGDIWGVDRIFSFYPFEPSRIDASGSENRAVRASFTSSGLVAPYDASQHPATKYSFYRPVK